jgi:winged helix-turn-helix protein DUF2582
MSTMGAAGTMEKVEKDSATVQGEIGAAAGAIWRALAENGGCALPKLRKSIECSAQAFDWAIGWLAREDKIAITREKRSFLVHLKEPGS